MGTVRFGCYEEFAKRIEFPVITFKADTGEVVIMNYEAKLILGQKTEKIELKLEQNAENSKFWSQLHDRKALMDRRMILSNGTRQFSITGIINEFMVEEQTYYMLLFDLRSASEANYRMLEQTIENSNAVIAHIGFDGDRELKVNYISRNINRFGYTCDEFYNGKLQFRDIFHPDDLDMVIHRFIEQSKGKKDTDNMEYRIVTESRKVCYVQCNVHFIRNDHGSVDGMELIMVDVTEGKMEKTENQYLRDAIEQSNSVVLVARFTKGKGIVKYASANAAGLGMNVEDLRKGRRLFSDYVIAEDRQKVLDILRNVENITISNYTSQCRILGDDGIMRWVNFCTTIKNVDTDTYDAELLIHDITNVKNYEENLLQSQKKLEDKLNYIASEQIETSEWEFEDFLAKEDVELFLKTFADVNQVYAAGIDIEGNLLTRPAGPMIRLGEFYDMLEKPDIRERAKEALSQTDSMCKFNIIELEEGNPERQLGIVPVMVDGRIISAILICGLDAEAVTRMHNSIESLQKLSEILIHSQFHNKYLELDSRKSRLAEDTMREELEGQLILAKAFANMRSNMEATVQEIIEKSCELLHVSSIAIYYGEQMEESFSCIAKHAIDVHRNWDYPDQSWRMAELCRSHPEIAKGGYLVYGIGDYAPQMEAIMANIKAQSMIICGIQIRHEVCGGLIIATDEKRLFNEREIAYCMDVANIIQGILYRKQKREDVDAINKNLLNTYNYVKECVFIKDVQTGKVLFANEAMENLFGIDVTGLDSRAFLAEPTPIYTRDGVQPIGDIRWQSYIQRVNKIMNIQELAIDWRDGRKAKIVIMQENTKQPVYS